MKKIKICGIRREEDVAYINAAGPDYIGFIFAATRRYISPLDAKKLSLKTDSSIKKVGVFVNEDISLIKSIADDKTIDIIQLHGDEDGEYIKALRELTDDAPIIKAVRVRDRDDIIKADSLDVDFLLLDTYKKGMYGGTGESFGWELIPDNLRHKYFLAGGLSEDNIRQALNTSCYGVDISGGVETDGVKDEEKIKNIVKIIRNI